MTCEAEIVATGKIASVNSVKGPYEVVHEDCVLKVSEVIKGSPAKEIKFCYRHVTDEQPAWLTSKGDLLVFLHVHKTPYDESKLYLYTDPYYEARLHGLLMPIEEQRPFPIFELSSSPADLYSKEMKRLANFEEVLQIARAWSGSAISQSIQIEVPLDSPVYTALYGGGACYLGVPAEEKYRAYFTDMAASEKPYERQRAAKELAKFPGDDTERILTALLKDNSEDVWTRSADTIASIEFGVRAAAYRSLDQLGKHLPVVQTERQPTDDEGRSLRQKHWFGAFTEALIEEWKLISVEDGDTRPVENLNITAVIVTCGKGDSHFKIKIIPMGWGKAYFPDNENLGVYQRGGQQTRCFFLEGAMPAAVKERLQKYFGLTKD